MLHVVKNEDRGSTKIDWLESYHSFSFGEYFDPENLHFGPLRVINDDIIAAGAGFPTHPHRDMEILTLVLEGAIAHKDSTGNSGEVRYGEVQKMSAGKGILHSEFNPSDEETLRSLQIWIIPDVKGIKPSYEQKKFPFETEKNKLIKIAAKEENPDVIYIHQSAEFYFGNYTSGNKLNMDIPDGKGVYFMNLNGTFNVNGTQLNNRDAAEIIGENVLTAEAETDGRFILFVVNP